MEQEASSQSPLAGDSAFSYWPPQLLLLLLNSCCCCCQGTRCCSCRANGSVAASCPLLPLLPLPPAFFFFFPRVPGGEAGAFSSPTGGGARLAERPLRFGPYSRALTTATAPPASIRLRRMAGWRRRVARLGLGCCPRSCYCCCCCPCCPCCRCCRFEAIGCLCQRQSGCCCCRCCCCYSFEAIGCCSLGRQPSFLLLPPSTPRGV
jgi:hypothetical protein